MYVENLTGRLRHFRIFNHCFLLSLAHLADQTLDLTVFLTKLFGPIASKFLVIIAYLWRCATDWKPSLTSPLSSVFQHIPAVLPPLSVYLNQGFEILLTKLLALQVFSSSHSLAYLSLSLCGCSVPLYFNFSFAFLHPLPSSPF